MIKSVVVNNYRGIRHGELKDLPRIAVLTGPNGCGKSSVLEALQIGGNAPQVSDKVVARRDGLPSPYRWLIHKGESGAAKIRVDWDDGAWLEKKVQDGRGDLLSGGNGEAGGRQTLFIEQRAGRQRQPLHQVFSDARRRGGADSARDLLAEVDPSIRSLEILTDGDTPVLHLAYDDRVVPAALAGDGMEALVRIALELSRRKEGTFLLEEPEAHQHSAAVLRSAKIIAAAGRQGCQIILTTHSMELLDGILSSLKEEELDLLAVYRLRLVAGELKVLRMPGKEVNAARTQIEDDLR